MGRKREADCQICFQETNLGAHRTKARGKKSRNSVKGIFVNPVGRGGLNTRYTGGLVMPDDSKAGGGKDRFQKRYRLQASASQIWVGFETANLRPDAKRVEDSKINESKVSIGFILPLLSFDDVPKRKEKTF
ncbi:UNVERIFIED_CONTAM: hypothetical protein Sindi_0637500 [Sesamum indicum]